MLINDAITDFLIALEADGSSPATLKWYASLLTAFSRHFDDTEMESITAAMIRQYIVTLRRRGNRYPDAAQRPEITGGVSEETIRAHVRALHGFWAWSGREYLLSTNPMKNIRQPKQIARQPKGISLDDVALLLSVCGDDPEGRRDRAIIAFLLDTGIRAQSIFRLEPAHMDISRRRAAVQEKRQGTRPVFFTERTAALLAAWLEVRPAAARTVFCSLARHTFGQPMTPTVLNRMLKRRAAEAGITGPCNPHAFRHAYAREYLRNGGDLATLSRLMGHSDVKVTADYYAVFAESELATSHDKFSPIKGVDEPEEGENTTN
jgi:integrase/recombinase XerD